MREGWTQTPLGDLFQVVDERLGAVTEEPLILSVTKHHGIVPADSFFNSRVASRDLSNYKVVETGDFAYSTIHIDEGAIARNHGPQGVVSPMYTVIRPSSVSVVPQYFEHLLRTPGLISEYGARAAGSINRRRSLPFAKFAQIEIDLPPVTEQRRIADLLGHAEDLLAHWKLERESLEALLRARIDAAARELKPRDLLGEVAEVKSGMAKGRKAPAEAVSVPFLRAANVQDGYLNLSDMHQLDVSAKDAERYALREGDVLLIEGSGSPARLGTGWIWEDGVAGCVHQNHVFAVRAGEGLEPRWLAFWITSSEARAYFRGCVKTSSGLATINKKQVAGLPIAVPDLATQRRLVRQLDAIAATRDSLHSRCSALETLRRAVTLALVSGTHVIPRSYDRFLADENSDSVNLERATV